MASEGNPVVDTEKEIEVSIPGENKRLDTREDVADMVKSIEESDGLTTLRLSGNSLGVEAAEAIAEVLAHKPTLRRALWSDMFVSRLKSEIPPAVTALGGAIITSQAHLVELDLSDNAFGPAGMVAVNTLLTSCYSLKILKFNNTGMGIVGGKLLSKALMECHEEADKAGQRLALEVFVAGRNRLENEGAIALSEVFETLGTLLHVSMPQNGINPEGICAMAKAFSKNTKLQVIDLNDNTITEDGSTAMAEVLPNIQELRVINFGDCLLRSGGAKAIAEALKDTHKLLEEVNLSYNELDQDAGLVVAEALSNKDELKKIELNGNSFGEQGIELLRESLEAKGRLDALGSLSEDEGEESDEGEEDVSTDEKLQVTVTPEKGSSPVTPDKGSPPVTPDKGLSHAQESGPSNQAPEMTLSEFLSCPSGENLLALGEERARLIREVAGEHPEPQRVAELYAKISSSYTDTCPNQVKKAVEETLDGLLQPFCEAGGVDELINELLVQLGLIKSEDKKFHPVNDVEGPLLALSYVVRQHYFPCENGDILIFFLTKSSPILEPVTHVRHRVLQVLHTL